MSRHVQPFQHAFALALVTALMALVSPGAQAYILSPASTFAGSAQPDLWSLGLAPHHPDSDRDDGAAVPGSFQRAQVDGDPAYFVDSMGQRKHAPRFFGSPAAEPADPNAAMHAAIDAGRLSFSPALAIPEPSTLVLILSGAVAIAWQMWRRRIPPR